MKQNVLYILLLVLLGPVAFAQDGRKATPADPLHHKIASVKELAIKIDEAKKKVDASAVSSRAAVQQSKDALAASYMDYQAELEKQIKLNEADKALRSALEKELESVKLRAEAAGNSH